MSNWVWVITAILGWLLGPIGVGIVVLYSIISIIVILKFVNSDWLEESTIDDSIDDGLKR